MSTRYFSQALMKLLVLVQLLLLLLTLLFCTRQSRALPSGTSSLGAGGLSSHAGEEKAKAAAAGCSQVQVVSQGHPEDWVVQVVPQKNWKNIKMISVDLYFLPSAFSYRISLPPFMVSSTKASRLQNYLRSLLFNNATQ